MCGRGTLVYDSAGFLQCKAAGCRAWNCPTCAVARKANLEIRLKQGNASRFLTLTANPKRGRSPADRRKKMGVAFAKLMRRIQHVTGVKPEAAVVVEDTKAGEPHFHVMLTCPFISKKLLKRWWYELTGAYIVKINLIRNARDVARYMVKYMSKDPVKFGNCKRYWFTKGYRVKRDGDEPTGRYAKGACKYEKKKIDDVMLEWRRAHKELSTQPDREGWYTFMKASRFVEMLIANRLALEG